MSDDTLQKMVEFVDAINELCISIVRVDEDAAFKVMKASTNLRLALESEQRAKLLEGVP